MNNKTCYENVCSKVRWRSNSSLYQDCWCLEHKVWVSKCFSGRTGRLRAVLRVTGSFILLFFRALSPFLGHAIARAAPRAQTSCSGGETTQTYLLYERGTLLRQTEAVRYITQPNGTRVDARRTKDNNLLVRTDGPTGMDRTRPRYSPARKKKKSTLRSDNDP